MRRRINSGLAPALVLLFGVSTAEAFVGSPSMPEGIGSAISPAAMCGRTCRGGGRYIPGPPSVCYERGLEYCGSSREGRTHHSSHEIHYSDLLPRKDYPEDSHWNCWPFGLVTI
jgi:hypothetical protein